jgi:tetratricopeptide (TPR) repeat protein
MVTPSSSLSSDDRITGESDALVRRALESYERGECDRAVDMLLAALIRTGGENRLACCLAELLIDSERFKDALEIISHVPPDARDIRVQELEAFCRLRLEDEEAACRNASRILDENPDSAAAMVVLGLIARRRGDSAGAGEWLRRAATAVPGCGEAFLQLGLLAKDNGAPLEALGYFERALKTAPVSRSAALNYHAQAVALGEVERVEAFLCEHVTAHPLNRRLCFLRIDLLLRMGREQAAMSAIEAALADFGIDGGLLAEAISLRERLSPTEDAAPGEGLRDGVSLCMIVKDEERHLARCLASVRPIVQEVVVVDTGSSDRSREIARAFGARLYDYPWQNDFAAARNRALAKAGCRWILVLDADEAISPADHDRFHKLVHDHCERATAFSVRTRNYTSQMNVVGWQANTGDYPAAEAGSGWFPSDKVRLFPNDPRIRFVQPVHEMVEPTLRRHGIPITACDIPVHHYGKLEEARERQKTWNYRSIQHIKVRYSSGDPAARRELAIQAAQLGNHEEALALWQQLIAGGLETAEAHVNMGTALWNLGRYRDAVRSAETAVRIDPSMKEARFNLAIAELHCGNSGRAARVLERLQQRHPRYAAGQFLLVAAYGCRSEHEKAQAALAALKSTPLGAHLAVSFLDLARRLESAGQKAFARQVAEVALRGGVSGTELQRWLDERALNG